ncbi:membrane protein [Gordonia phage Crater]|nr:membrane protein [Gordonia phage Crater]
MELLKDRGIQASITAAAVMATGTIIIDGHPAALATLWAAWAGITGWAIWEARRKHART